MLWKKTETRELPRHKFDFLISHCLSRVQTLTFKLQGSITLTLKIRSINWIFFLYIPDLFCFTRVWLV